eukprot:CAMPEP_0182857276 /NCGR_PEP_ID=MMETSP0034_2-20130328/2951_1 /TAXON_ID=156128 /ORGANISM="Nephroselmis pyriformis, Strain CCMP717" /LENGTH=218 /DNA_ID=CAMNT_0024988491 /DNA_START=405 /DNA_END=1060 /DNA_ORIENTATION=-
MASASRAGGAHLPRPPRALQPRRRRVHRPHERPATQRRGEPEPGHPTVGARRDLAPRVGDEARLHRAKDAELTCPGVCAAARVVPQEATASAEASGCAAEMPRSPSGATRETASASRVAVRLLASTCAARGMPGSVQGRAAFASCAVGRRGTGGGLCLLHPVLRASDSVMNARAGLSSVWDPLCCVPQCCVPQCCAPRRGACLLTPSTATFSQRTALR